MKTVYQLEIINKIKKIREHHKFSQKLIAELLGISNGQVGNIESTKSSHKYTLEQINIICNEFDYPIEQIFLESTEFSCYKTMIKLIISKIINYERG